MKEKNFVTKTGEVGTSYHLEAGDVLEVIEYDKVGMTERDAMIQNPKKPNEKIRTAIKSYFIKVMNKSNNQIVTLSLTQTQGEQAKKLEPLSGKVLIGEAYKNKYGDQVALRLKK